MREFAIALENIDRRRYNEFSLAIAAVNFGFNGQKVPPLKSKNGRENHRTKSTPEREAAIERMMREKQAQLMKARKKG